jgi:glucose/arabinose dehydrogenase
MNYPGYFAPKSLKANSLLAVLVISINALAYGAPERTSASVAPGRTGHADHAGHDGSHEIQSATVLSLPAGFIDEPVIGGLGVPRAFVFPPDGRIFVTEGGSATSDDINFASIQVFKNGQLLPERAITFDVCGDGERGLLGMELDPDFSSNGYIYVYYTRQSQTGPACAYDTFTNGQPGPGNRISRLTMVGDVIEPGSERILIDNIITDAGIHNAGDLHFGPDGYLYISTADGGLRHLPAELNNLNGKILRIKPLPGDAGGYVTTGNPFDGVSGAQKCGVGAPPFGSTPCREVYAYGLRNPWRFAIQGASGDTFIGDVGSGGWEEINRLMPGANYGYPGREGAEPLPTPPGITDPIYAYSHELQGTTVDTAVTGGAFYTGSVPNSTSYPSEYLNNYFLVDAYQGFIRRLVYDTPTATWNPATPDFATNAYGVIGLKPGQDGNLYYMTFDGTPGFKANQIRRIRYVGGVNLPPVAQISANPPNSPQLSTIYTVSAAKSYDLDNNLPLSYSWDFGDGTTRSTTSPTVTHQYATPGPKTITLVVRDSGSPPQISAPATVQVFPGNTAPTASVVLTNITDSGRVKYHMGDTWRFGVDNLSDDEPLPANALRWSVVFHHNTHTHPFLSNIEGASGQFNIAQLGETAPDVWYRVILQVTDAQGQTVSFQRDIYPETTNVALLSNPPGVSLRIDNQRVTTPAAVTRVVGINSTVDVPPQPQLLFRGLYQFVSWSNGGDALQSFAVSPGFTLTATFTKIGPAPYELQLPLVDR